MGKDEKPTVCLIGLSKDEIELLPNFLGNKYNFLVVNHNFPLIRLQSYDNIQLFIINTDLVWANIRSIVNKIKTVEKYHNTPFLGLAMKRHLEKLTTETKDLFEDILIMPCNKEDFLTRVEVWAETGKSVSGKCSA